MKILAVDDGPDALRLLVLNIQRHGHEALQAHDGEEALTIATTEMPDLIIMDMMMPKLDGYGLLRALKQDHHLDIPCVVYSAVYNTPKEQQVALDLGAVAFLVKPMEPERFWEEIQKVIEALHQKRLPQSQPHKTDALDFFGKYSDIMTERLMQEMNKLKASEKRYKTLFMSIPDIVMALDANGHIIDVNHEALRQILGYLPEEVFGKSICECCDKLSNLCKFKENAPQDAILRIEMELKRKDGSQIPCYIFFVKLEEVEEVTDDQPAFMVIIKDISEEKEHERIMASDEERYRLILELVSKKWDSEEQVIDGALDSAVRLTMSEAGYLHFFDNDKDIVLYSWSKNVRSQCNVSHEMHYPLEQAGIWADSIRLKKPVIHNDYQACLDKKGYPEGHFHIVRHMSVPILEKDKIVAILGVGNKEKPYDAMDAHQLKLYMQGVWRFYMQYRAEKEAERLRADWDRTFDASDSIISMQNSDMCIKKINKTGLLTLGLDESQVVGRKCYDVFRGINKPCDECPVKHTFQDFSPYTAEVYNEKLNKTLLVSTTPLLNTYGIITGIVHMARDITQQKELEKQLRHTQKLEAIGTLAAGIAHDFNNLLTSILGYSELLSLKLPKDSEESDELQQVITAGRRATELVKQILTFSRSGEHKPSPLYLPSVVKEVIKLLKASIPSSIVIKQVIDEKCHDVLADPTQIHQVIMNLCTNAYHAMKDNGGTLTVSLYEEFLLPASVKDGVQASHVVIKVQDTGCGIPKENYSRIFEPYFTTKKHGEGTGLGLSVVHGIVKRHGGYITFDSKEGIGTTFYVYLPIAVETEKEEIAPALVLEPPRFSTQKRILAVDDEMSIGTMIQSALENYDGYVVTVSDNSAKALKTFTANPDGYDMVITDMAMPEMDGVELTRKLREAKSNLPVILCTGLAEARTSNNIQGVSFNAVILKPFTIKTLVDAIIDALKPVSL